MKRLLLALPLLWHLSGVAGVAAMVCMPAAPMHCACCESQQPSTTHLTPTSANCPCKVSPKPRDPDPGTVLTTTSQTSDRASLTTAGFVNPQCATSRAALPGSGHSHSDLSPPYLTAAPPRC